MIRVIARHGEYIIIGNGEGFSIPAVGDGFIRDFFHACIEFHLDFTVSYEGIEIRKDPRFHTLRVLTAPVDDRDPCSCLIQFKCCIDSRIFPADHHHIRVKEGMGLLEVMVYFIQFFTRYPHIVGVIIITRCNDDIVTLILIFCGRDNEGVIPFLHLLHCFKAIDSQILPFRHLTIINKRLIPARFMLFNDKRNVPDLELLAGGEECLMCRVMIDGVHDISFFND